MEEKFRSTTSKFGKRIDLSINLWKEKILQEHPEFTLHPEYLNEVLKTIAEAEYIVEGWKGEYLALRWCNIAPKSPKYLCVVYRELEERGFVITTFFESMQILVEIRNSLRIYPSSIFRPACRRQGYSDVYSSRDRRL